MNAEEKAKPRVAFFDFTSCEGCQLTVLDALQTHPELLDVIEIVEFREAISNQSDDYQIAFIEGSCTRPSDEKRLQEIRKTAAVIIALGSCAHIGGINAIRNTQPLNDVREYVYGDKAEWYDTYPARSISQVIQVDAIIPGCPIDRNEFVRMVTQLLQGRQLKLPDYPLCIECKSHENICVFTQGQVCLGPITRAGCDAICPTYGYGCEGCRGLLGSYNMESFNEVLAEHGLDQRAIDAKMSLFLTNQLLVEEEVSHG
ncbi:MAG: NADH:ubiquinone oxidoreductase [Chloroflexi bacterium]|nr:NADH:ubiquinone oxidoreductase [Chloroflexota bacterium]